MDPALYISMTGAKRNLVEQGVYSNNLANVNTTGFQGDLYQAESLYVNRGQYPVQVYTASTPSAISFEPGPMMSTGRDLDAAVRGQGWFVVQNSQGDQGLTRAGNFSVNQAGLLTMPNGDLVMGNGGPISVPPYESIQLGDDGSVTIVPLGSLPTERVNLDRLMLVNPDHKDLVKGGDGYLYSNQNKAFTPDAKVTIVNNTLEGSNVNSVEQLVGMMNSSRSFETQLKLISTIDENQQVLARLLQI